jgi:hypothetical protein
LEETHANVSSALIDLASLGIHPLSLNQQVVLLSRQLAKERLRTFHPGLIRIGLNLDGIFDAERVTRSLARVVNQHAALRVTFAPSLLVAPPLRRENLMRFARTGLVPLGAFSQTVTEETSVPIIERDISSQTTAEQELSIKLLSEREGFRHFEDGDSPRLRAILLKLTKFRHLLLLFVDHLVFDGLSVSVLTKEFTSAFQSKDQLVSSNASPVRSSFPVFCSWQNRALQGSSFRSSVQYWRDQWVRFASARVAPQDLEFAIESTTLGPNVKFATCRLVLATPEAAGIKVLARKHSCSIFAVFLAALAVVLHQYTAKSSVAVWGHFANRTRPQFADTIGWFSNSHILGIDLQGNPTLSELLCRVRDCISVALLNQELPLPHLWNTLRCIPRFRSPTVLIDYARAPVRSLISNSDLNVTHAQLPDSSAPRFALLGLYVVEHSDCFVLKSKYFADGFKAEGVRQWLSEVATAAIALARSSEVTLSKFVVDNSLSPRGGNARDSGMGEFIVFDSDSIPQSQRGEP